MLTEAAFFRALLFFAVLPELFRKNAAVRHSVRRLFLRKSYCWYFLKKWFIIAACENTEQIILIRIRRNYAGVTEHFLWRV